MPGSGESDGTSRGPVLWSAEEIRRFGREVVDLIVDHLTGLPDEPVFRPVSAPLAERFLRTPAPRAAMSADALLAELEQDVLPHPFGNGHPRFWGWANSPPTIVGIFADALAAAMNPSCAGGNHAAIYVEHQVINWFKEMLGFPSNSAGILVSGGSMANLTALAVARHTRAGFDVRRDGLQAGHPQLRLYVSSEGHGCLRKAAELLGIGSANVVTIAVDAHARMDVDDLRTHVEADHAAGHRPFAVAASAGTVNTGVIDPLGSIAEVCHDRGLWFHVDGSLGAPAILARQYRDELAALASADSVAVDPHKWLSVPVEAGVVLVKDAAGMRDAFSLVPPYLRTDDRQEGVGGPPWFSEFGFQQTRGFRALKVWMSLKHYGLDGYAHMIEEHIDLARHLHARIAAADDLEALAAPGLSVVCFRFAPTVRRSQAAALDALNRSLLERLQLGGQVFVSGTTVGGVFALRACVLNYRSTRADLDMLVDLVRQEGRKLVG